jgi:DNA-binding transcriptional regulator GbsR (MarR family)
VPDEASVTGAKRPGAEPKGPDQEAVLRYIERFTSLLISLGVPPMPARVFAALLITDSGRMTAAELASMLVVSRAAISDGVRYLTGLGLIHREREPGSRRDYYRMPDDVWITMLSLRDQTLLRWIGLLREGIELIGARTPAGTRMAEHAAYVEFVSKELPGIVQRWEEYKAALPPDGGY